jgi:hypothetical protein
MQKFNNITIVPSFGARVRYIHRTVGFLINVRIGQMLQSRIPGAVGKVSGIVKPAQRSDVDTEKM